MAQRIKTVEVYAGDFCRVHIFPVRNCHRGRRGRKFRPSSAAQEKYNQKRRELYLRDLLHANFTERGFALRLSYDGESPDVETAQAALRRFIRRLKRWYQKHGAELKYIYCTERGKNHGRVHHHMVVNDCPGLTDSPYFFRDLWANGGLPGGRGYVYAAPLEFAKGEGGAFEDGGLTGLSKYIVYDKQKTTSKQYGRSRNLEEPEVIEHIGTVTSREVERMTQTGDFTDFVKRYADYDIYDSQFEQFNAAHPGDPPVTGIFATVCMRRRVMKFNVR